MQHLQLPIAVEARPHPIDLHLNYTEHYFAVAGFVVPILLILKVTVVIIVIAKLGPHIEVVLMLMVRIFRQTEEEVHLYTNYRLHLKVLQGYKGTVLLSCSRDTVLHELAIVLRKHIRFCFLGLRSLASQRLQVFQAHPRTQEALQLGSQEVTEI